MVKVDLSGIKIPKKVAGVKVPKQLRKQGKKLLEKANSPAGREAIAAGLTIAGAAIAAKARAKAERTQRWAGEGPVGGDAPRATEAPRPGAPGIDPAMDFGAAVSSGLVALQTFLAGKRTG